MRYKRKRYYKKSTNVIRMKFQSFMDISTQADEMQIISVSAGGANILKRLPAQFAAYKYYKIGNIAVKLVPASTLPVDPSGLSYEPGENQVDPRDQLTPGMMRITNGEDVFEDLTGVSADVQHAIYNNMLLDPRWYKWMLQSGVKRHATPRYWQIGQLHQDKWPGATLNVPDYGTYTSESHGDITDTTSIEFHQHGSSTEHITSIPMFQFKGDSSSLGIFQTGHRGVLGWLPTNGYQFGQPFIAAPPEVEVMKILLPPAYDTRFYYRMFITETVFFKEPVVMASGQYRPMDVFNANIPMSILYPLKPTYPTGASVSDTTTGGNYGDN